ncbi:hypothetical protein [Ekhidna sp.]|uniref:hypothetical protein n=1 Tax=Ekhidna sp. TaxID=2608089 RepID=UPI0032EF5BAE
MKLLYHSCIIFIIVCSCGTNQSTKEKRASGPAVEQQEVDKAFNYEPEKPQKGKLNAVIELGALGLNYFIISIDAQGRWDLKKAKYGRSNLIYGVNSTAEITAKINEFKNEIINFGVAGKDIHLLASSSVVKTDQVSVLNEKLKSLNLKIKSINADMEAQYALMATIPREFIEESFLVDIGSGNTKISWVQDTDTLSIEIHGSKYFLSDVQDTTVFREVRDAILEVPTQNRNLCFVLGGMIYEFVKDEINSSEKRYFVLDPPDAYPIDNEKLKAAYVIYNALYLEPTYSYIFDSKSNFSIGYLISLKK